MPKLILYFWRQTEASTSYYFLQRRTDEQPDLTNDPGAHARFRNKNQQIFLCVVLIVRKCKHLFFISLLLLISK